MARVRNRNRQPFSLHPLERRVLLATYFPADGPAFAADLNRATFGDTIVLTAGTTYTGSFVLKDKGAGTGWITIQSSQLNALPAAGVRVSPADAVNMPRIVAPGSNVPAIQTQYGAATGAHHFKFIGLEIAGPADNSGLVNLVELGTTDSVQNSLAMMPHHFVIDRCYLHSNFNTATGKYDQALRRAIALNSGSTDITNCYVAEIHENGSDSQAIGGSNGAGPYNIINNHLEAASENILFGGSGVYIPDTVPSDIVIRGNHCIKPLSWRGVWDVKNLFELKAGRRILVEGNLFENNWNSAQDGTAIVIKIDQYNSSRPWHVTEDVTFRNNIVRHAANGLAIQGRDWEGTAGSTQSPPGLVRRITVSNNLWYDLQKVPWANWKTDQIGGNFLYLTQGPLNVTVDHNTIINGRTPIIVDSVQYPTSNFVFTNNLTAHNAYGMYGANASPATGDSVFDMYFYDAGARFLKNVMMDTQAMATLYDNVTRAAPHNPNLRAVNYWPTSWTAVGFVDQANDNYRLAASSPYRNIATDGTDLGANIDAIEHASAGAINGMPFAYKVGTTLYVKFGDAPLPITLSNENGALRAGKWVSSVDFTGVTGISVTGTTGDDVLELNAPIAPPMTIADGAGNDTVLVQGVTQTFAGDIGTPSRNWGIQLGDGAQAQFNTSQHLRALALGANAKLLVTAGGSKVLRTGGLSIANFGLLNLADNDLILDYTGSASPIGSVASGAYTQVSGWIQSGRNFGYWNGATGIVTTMSSAVFPNRLTTLGVSEAADAKHITGLQTALFAGETVDATTVLVKYTYTGDADLSGRLDGDDYFIIDLHAAAAPGTPASWGWWHGDFDYAGTINGDDYFLLDSNLGRQGVVL
jgi:hypothetical protein